MRKELSALDIHYLLKEFSSLVDAKIDKVFQREHEFLLQLFLPNKKKEYFWILIPNFMFLSEAKDAFGDCGNFGLSLRKHITNNRIRGIKQLGFERIIEIELESKDSKYFLIIELFRPGNIILCDQSYKIILALDYKAFGSRVIRPGIQYSHPNKEYNLFNLNERDFVRLIEASDKDSIAITLAVNLGFGGLYSEELCTLAGLDKKKSKLSMQESKKLFNAVKKITEHESCGYLYYDNDSLIDIAPIELEKYKDKRIEKRSTFNDALKPVLEKAVIDTQKEKKNSKYEQQKSKLISIIKNQEKQIEGFESSFNENQKKAEAIYEKYTTVNKILLELNEALKKYSWKEIREKSKNSKIIKDIDEKEKRITVEI